ncbi:MAG: hypothetical protein AUJ57_03145 [Zetaproteobacteria bacterium CG1_02_53_45]|nr:MAG: hypothetical protein AUJ57_03145 [Zetaproteobacteria bacterium CG1_02_53_45]
MSDREVLLRFSQESPFAFRNGQPVDPAQLFSDVARTVQLMGSDEGDVLVTCKGRYEFSVALLSIWSCGKNAVLPPNLHAATLAHVRSRHSISSQLQDGFTGSGNTVPARNDQKSFELRFYKKLQAVTIYTSGSTGNPRPVVKSIGDIFAEAIALGQAFDWPDKPLVASVPPHHLYGLTFSVLLPWVRGIPMVNECPLHAEEVVDAIRQVNAGTLISVPVHLRALLDQQFCCKPAMVISSAGALDGAIAQQWHERFGRQIVEVYGSSETGVIAHRRQLSDLSWTPFSEVIVGSSEAGLLQVTSPFINASEGDIYQTQDLVSIQPESGFQLHGRADAIVKIAGKRVSLLTIENTIKSCEGVMDAAVIAVPVQGYIRDMAIWAAVSTGEESSMNARSLRTQLLSMLDGIEVPRRIVVLKQLPREENGKLRREQLMALFIER